MNDSATTHFKALVWVLTECASERIELLEHSYHPGAFGSFELVLAKGHTQARFEWDGKESVLRLFFAKVQNRGAAPTWAHEADFSVPGGDGLYEELCSRAVELLAT